MAWLGVNWKQTLTRRVLMMSGIAVAALSAPRWSVSGSQVRPLPPSGIEEAARLEARAEQGRWQQAPRAANGLPVASIGGVSWQERVDGNRLVLRRMTDGDVCAYELTPDRMLVILSRRTYTHYSTIGSGQRFPIRGEGGVYRLPITVLPTSFFTSGNGFEQLLFVDDSGRTSGRCVLTAVEARAMLDFKGTPVAGVLPPPAQPSLELSPRQAAEKMARDIAASNNANAAAAAAGNAAKAPGAEIELAHGQYGRKLTVQSGRTTVTLTSNHILKEIKLPGEGDFRAVGGAPTNTVQFDIREFDKGLSVRFREADPLGQREYIPGALTPSDRSLTQAKLAAGL